MTFALIRCVVKLTGTLDTLDESLGDGLVNVLRCLLCRVHGGLLNAHRGAEEANVAGEGLAEHLGGCLRKV